MAKNFEKLIFVGLHEKHAVQRGIWVPSQHSLCDQGKPRKTLIDTHTHTHTLVVAIFSLLPHRKHVTSPLQSPTG
jgi:hypothetical protein